MESPGSLIKRARVAASMELSQLAAVTKIPHTSLAQLEDDAYDKLPAEVFVRGFLRNIARELKVDKVQIIEAYEQHTGRVHKSAPVEVVEVKNETPVLKMTTSSLRAAPDRPKRSRLPSFDNVVEVVGSTRPAYVIGTLLVLLGIALTISVITNGLDYDQRLTFNDDIVHGASWDAKVDTPRVRGALDRNASIMGTTTLDLIPDDKTFGK